MGIGLAVPEMLQASAHRDALQPIEVTDFRNVLSIWLVHGLLPGRLVRPVALMRDALARTLGLDRQGG